MRFHYLSAAAVVLLLVSGCTSAPGATPATSASSTPPAGSASPSKSASPSETTAAPTSEPGEGSGQGAGDPDDSGRFSYSCTSLNAVPDTTFSSLAEVWASSGYLRLDSCTANYQGPQPYEPTDDEARIIGIAEPGTDPAQGLESYLAALGLCTRVSDDSASQVFGGSSRQLLQAASELCPKAPQGKIIALWAVGARAGDGQYAVGDGGLAAGRFHLRKTPPEGCTWSVIGSDGAQKAGGGAVEGQSGILLAEKDVLSSDKCGIWEKME
ncbi:hypothetical protein ACFUOZ_04725 [Paenarthrobacter sp. NPDC057355]|uniref:hypothetical protein n=1 Tax=Paenarthrobacter sp. NPDC057355 TaxID=3346105 RepID=UPI0036390E0A